MPNNPHLNSEGHDVLAQTRHCVGCEIKLEQDFRVLVTHYMGNWYHYRTITQPVEIARDPKTGHTLEGVIAKPERPVRVKYNNQAVVHYCANCANFHEGHKPPACNYCGDMVDTSEPHTVAEHLYRETDRIKPRLLKTIWHPECLPEEFKSVPLT